MNQEQPPQPGYYPAPPTPSGMSTGAKIALVLIVGFCAVTGGCFALVTFIYDNAKQNLNANSASASSPFSNNSPTSSGTTYRWTAQNRNVKRSCLKPSGRERATQINFRL